MKDSALKKSADFHSQQIRDNFCMYRVRKTTRPPDCWPPDLAVLFSPCYIHGAAVGKSEIRINRADKTLAAGWTMPASIGTESSNFKLSLSLKLNKQIVLI